LDVAATAVVDFTWSVAHATVVEASDAVVCVVTDAVAVGVSCAGSSAISEDISGEARSIVISSGGIVVARKGVGAPFDFGVVAYAVAIGVG
jgi:hypothetical protein